MLQDGETIDYTWTRVKTNKNYLKLKSAQKTDTGVFVCRGVNGFGSVKVRVELIVTDPNHPDDSMELPIAPPVFTKKTQSLQNFIKKIPGESLNLPCEALGSPKPAISWLHNGHPLSTSSVLTIPGLGENDSGTYTCLATNLAGTVKHQFSVTVESPRVELPAISQVSNTSVFLGETAMLQCKVTSSITPSIQWLREMVGSERSINLANMELVNVGDGDMVKVSDNTYLNTLILDSVRTDDSGLYVCFATNTAGGFNYQSATLKVLSLMEDLPLPDDDQQLLLGLLIGLVSVVLILASAIFLCLVRSRHKLLQPDYSESQRSIIYQKNTLDHANWNTDDAVSWSSLQKSVSNHTPVGGHRILKHQPCATSNIYDLPFNHSSRDTPHKVIHYTPISQSVHSPCSTRVSRISSLPSSPALTHRNTRHLPQRKDNLQFVTQYQNI